MLAAVGQVLALLGPVIFGKIIDNYAMPPFTLTADKRVKGALGWMLLAVVTDLFSGISELITYLKHNTTYF